MNGITARQQEVLNFIVDFSDKNLYPPTVRDIATHFNFAIKAAQDHLSALQKKGYITNEKNLSRSLSVVRDFKLNPYAPFVLRIPILAKEINPKFPIFSKENIDAYFVISEPFIEKNKNYFLLSLTDLNKTAESENSKNEIGKTKNPKTKSDKTKTGEPQNAENPEKKLQKFALIEKIESKISNFDFKNLILENEIFIYQNKKFVIGKILNENSNDSENSICVLSSSGEKITFPKLSKKEVLGILKLTISNNL